jgi:hypothetical protein
MLANCGSSLFGIVFRGNPFVTAAERLRSPIK